MRFSARISFTKLSGLVLGFLAVLGVMMPPVEAQTAPYVLPYTMSTYAGSHAIYTVGAACGTNTALDIAGAGCIASLFSVGADPHDVRVDPLGNVYFISNISQAVLYKINAKTGIVTVAAGSYTKHLPCTSSRDAYGDGCPATDGAANYQASGSAAYYTSDIPKSRGLAIAPNGDVYLATYQGNYIAKISTSTDVMSSVAGLFSGSGSAALAAVGFSVEGSSATAAALGSPRGVAVDAAGNIYIADTINDVIRRVDAVTGTIKTFAGSYTTATASGVTTYTGVAGYTGDNGPALSATLSSPEDVKVDSYGNVYIADYGNNVIRVVYEGGTIPGVSNPTVGYIYTVAGGGTGSYPGYPVAATSLLSLVVSPAIPAFSVRKMSLDSNNNIYAADSANNVVWFIDHATGYIRVIAGTISPTALTSVTCTGQTDTVGDGCVATQAMLWSNSNMGTAADGSGNLYITDYEGGAPNARIRKVLNNQTFPSVAAGSSVSQTILVHFAPGTTPTSFGISGTQVDYAITNTPLTSCTVNGDGTTDCPVIVSFTPTRPGVDDATLLVNWQTGTTPGTAVALPLTGTGTAAAVGIDPGASALLTATVKAASGIAVDSLGNAVIADTGNNRILYYNGSTTSVIAGGATAGYSGDNGLAAAAQLNAPKGVAFDAAGNIYIADTGNNAIRKISASTSIITTIGGGATTACSLTSADAIGNYCPATQAILTAPTAVAVDTTGNIYVADNTSNPTLRAIGTSGYIFPFAGGATSSTLTGCTVSNPDTVGDLCTGFVLGQVGGMQLDSRNSNLYIADTGNNMVRKLALGTRLISAVAGTGQTGSTIDSSGLATGSQLDAPTGVGVDASGNIYIADTGNHAIRLVTAGTGTISTIAGIITASGTGVTLPTAATKVQLNAPGGIAVTPAGTLYIADTGNNRVLSDVRGQITYDFGRISPGFLSPAVSFTELATGSTATTLGSPVLTAPASTDGLSLVGSGSTGCTSGQILSIGTTCTLSGQFDLTAITTLGFKSASYVENGTNVPTAPSITLTGTAAILTTTGAVITQTYPVSGNPQFGGTLTLSATVTPVSCNSAAPSCFPTGTITFYVDNVAQAPVTLNAAATASDNFSGLSVGSHSIVVVYSGDDYYASTDTSSTLFSVTVTTASTTTQISIAPASTTQFSTASFTATVTPTTSAPNPVGTTITFYVNGTTTVLGTAQLDTSGRGTAVLTIGVTYATDGTFASNTTLAPGTYSITASFPGSANYTGSVSAAGTFTVTADPADFIQMAKPCRNTAQSTLTSFTPATGCTGDPSGTLIAVAVSDPNIAAKSSAGTTGGTITSYLVCPLSSAINIPTVSGQTPVCVNAHPDGSNFLYSITFFETNSFSAGQVVTVSGATTTTALNLPYTVLNATGTYWTAQLPVVVGTGQGSTADATIFIRPSNSLTGTLTYSCSGLPANSTCTFSPTSYALTPGSGAPVWVPITVTLWTDLQAGTTTSLLMHGKTPHDGVKMATLLGWPVLLVGLFGVIGFRRKNGLARALTMMALACVISGSSLLFTGCGSGGPGAYKPNLTPTGQYPVTVTVTNGTVSHSTIVYFNVAAGITGIE